MRRGLLALLLVVLAAPAWAGSRARYGGELRVLAPAQAANLDPAQLSTPTDVAVARLVHGTLFDLDGDGALSAGLAAGIPEAEASGRVFRIRLKPGLRFHEGSPLTAQDVVASLQRLADPALASPFAALSLPLVGAAEGGKISGLAATGELDLQASLAFPYPDWPRALAHPATAPLPAGRMLGRPIGTGPLLFSSPGPGADLRLQAFPECAAGRSFADTVKVSVGDPRAAARALSLGEAEIVLGSTDKKAIEGPALFATYLAVNAAKLGPQAAAVRQAVEATVDVQDLARFFVRGAAPMAGLLPPVLDPAATAPVRPARPALPAGMQLVLLTDASAEDQKTVGDRLQIKLHDLGVAVQVRRVPHAAFREALVSGGYDLALVAFAALPDAGMALAQLVLFGQGRDPAREVLRQVGGGADPGARRAIALVQAAHWRSRLPLVPLYVQVPRLAVRAGVVPVGFDGCGAPSLADAWFEAKPAPK